ncbi:MAG: hypothetical protein HWN65_22890 [Candidatus Helarchaeota archaeon]|nr:hypothetical protein [Candidatus Helarchaeota archaeon]
MTLIDLLMDNPRTVIAYTIFFAILALILPFFGHVGRIFPRFNKKQNLIIARILSILAIFGIILTVLISFLFVYVKLRDIVTFEIFGVVTFVFPLLLAPLVFAPFYLSKPGSLLREGRTVEKRHSAELFIVYAAFGVVASNFHDILWCGEKTSWFTVTGYNGYELEIWVDIVGANTYDYVFFGFFMLLHVIFCGTLATFMLWRYTRRYGESLIRNPHSRWAFILAWGGSLIWGYGLYVMDSFDRHTEILWFFSTFVLIPLGILILGYSGKFLSKFEQN